MKKNSNNAQTLKSSEVCNKYSKSVSYETLVGGTATIGREYEQTRRLSKGSAIKPLTAVGTLTSLLCNSAKVMEKWLQISPVLRLVKNIILVAVLSMSIASESWAETWNCGNQGNNVLCSFDGQTFTISGNGAMADYRFVDATGENDRPWDNIVDKIKHIIVEEGVTSIGSDAFQNATELLTVTGMKDVKTIGHDSFAWATNLSKIDMPNVEKVYNAAFWNNSSLTSVDMPKVNYINEHAFIKTSGLIYVGLPKTNSDGYILDDDGNMIKDENGNYIQLSISDGAFESSSLKTVPMRIVQPAEVAETDML